MDKEIRLGRFDKWGYKNSFSKGELARELTYMNRDYDKLEQQVKKQKEVIDKAIEYIKEKQKIQYKFALSHIECDDLLQILEGKEVSE